MKSRDDEHTSFGERRSHLFALNKSRGKFLSFLQLLQIVSDSI